MRIVLTLLILPLLLCGCRTPQASGRPRNLPPVVEPGSLIYIGIMGGPYANHSGRHRVGQDGNVTIDDIGPLKIGSLNVDVAASVIYNALLPHGGLRRIRLDLAVEHPPEA